MKIFFYILVSLFVSISIARVHQNELKPQPNQTQTLAFSPFFNVAVGPVNVLSAYPEAGVDFALNHVESRATVFTDAGSTVYPAKVFMLSGNTWTADLGDGDYITINAESGVTEMRVEGVYRCFNPEISQP